MKHKSFCGIAVHPARFSRKHPTMIGVVLPRRKISPHQRKQLMGLNVPLQQSLGHVAVRTNASGSTAIKLLGLILNQREARAVALHLARVVRKVTGACSILRQLPNYTAVSRALAS